MQAAGVMPALANLLFSSDAAAAATDLHPEACRLLVLLLQHKAAAVDAVKSEMLPALVLVHELCCNTNNSSDLQQAVRAALLLVLKPPATPTDAAAAAHFAVTCAGGKDASSAPAGATAATSGKPVKSKLQSGAAEGLASIECVETMHPAQAASLEAQQELGRCLSTASIKAGMQLLSVGECY